MHKVKWKGRLAKAASITVMCWREQREVRILMRAMLPELDVICSACDEFVVSLFEPLNRHSHQTSYDLRH